MAQWFYYNESGEKIEVTGGQLKGLAKAGMITPETFVETEEGKTGLAKHVKGLTFVAAKIETTLPEPSQSVSDIPLPAESNPPVPINSFAGKPHLSEDSFSVPVPLTQVSQSSPAILSQIPQKQIAQSHTVGIIIICILFAVGVIIIGQMIGTGNNASPQVTPEIVTSETIAKRELHIWFGGDGSAKHGARFEIWINGEKIDLQDIGLRSTGAPAYTSYLPHAAFTIDVPVGNIKIEGRVGYKNRYGAVIDERRITGNVTIPAIGRFPDDKIEIQETARTGDHIRPAKLLLQLWN